MKQKQKENDEISILQTAKKCQIPDIWTFLHNVLLFLILIKFLTDFILKLSYIKFVLGTPSPHSCSLFHAWLPDGFGALSYLIQNVILFRATIYKNTHEWYLQKIEMMQLWLPATRIPKLNYMQSNHDGPCFCLSKDSVMSSTWTFWSSSSWHKSINLELKQSKAMAKYAW